MINEEYIIHNLHWLYTKTKDERFKLLIQQIKVEGLNKLRESDYVKLVIQYDRGIIKT